MKSFLANTIYSLTGKAFGMIALVLLDILIARKLSVAEYAEWVYFFSIITFFCFVGWLGINSSTKVLISRCTNDPERRCYLTGGFILRVLSSVLISFLLMIVFLISCSRLGYPNKYSMLRDLINYSGFMIFANSFTEYYKEVFMGYGRFKRLFQLTIIEYYGYLCFSYLFLSLSNIVQMVALAYCLSGCFVFLFGIVILIRECGLFSLQYREYKVLKSYVFDIVKYAVPMLLVGVGVVVLLEIDTFMIGILSTKNEVAMYNIGKSINSKATHINYSIAVGGMTSFAVVLKSEYQIKRERFRKLGIINLVVAVFIALIEYVATPFVIPIFYGRDYLPAIKVAQLLIVYYILYAVSNFYSVFMDFRKKAKTRAFMYVGTIVFDVILNALLIPGYGAMGAAAATTISLIPYMIMAITISRKEWIDMKTDIDNENVLMSPCK